MSSPAYDIADFLENNGIGIVGGDIFNGTQPPEPDETITVIDGPGWANASPQIAEDYPSVKILVRGGSYNGNFGRAEAIKDLLVGLTVRDIGGRRVVGCWMVGDINWLGRDDQLRPQRSLNFNLIRSRKATQ